MKIMHCVDYGNFRRLVLFGYTIRQTMDMGGILWNRRHWAGVSGRRG